MEGNEVVLELIKTKRDQQYIMEVIRVDAERDLITIYQPNNGKGCLISNRPPSPPFDRDQYVQFDYKSLPSNYWKKYDLASKFVKMVRSRTPKITLHTLEAKCVLYDTSPDFECLFYQGTKINISKEGSIKITNTDGTCITLDSNSRSTCLAPDMQDMLEKAHKWHKFCIEEEQLREKRLQICKEIIAFPMTIGRKPLQPQMSTSCGQKTNNTTCNLDGYMSDTNNSVRNEKFILKSKECDNSNPKFSMSNHQPMSHYDLKSVSTSSLAALPLNNTNQLLNTAHTNEQMHLNQQQLQRQLNYQPQTQVQSPQQHSFQAMNNSKFNDSNSSSSASPMNTAYLQSSNSNSLHQPVSTNNQSNMHSHTQQHLINDLGYMSYNNQSQQSVQQRPQSATPGLFSSSSTSYQPIANNSYLTQSYQTQSVEQQYPSAFQQHQQIQIQQEQMKLNRQFTSPSPTAILANSIQPLNQFQSSQHHSLLGTCIQICLIFRYQKGYPEELWYFFQ